jgi:hypothetical protein
VLRRKIFDDAMRAEPAGPEFFSPPNGMFAGSTAGR